MKSLLYLELRKQRKTFLGLLLIIAISLTLVTASVSTFADLPLKETFLGITVMLQLIGIPFFGLLLAGSAGAALRSSDRKAEEDIPVRPIKRVFAAYSASLIYLIILSAILFSVSIPTQYATFLQSDFLFPFILVPLLPLHSAAFVFSYWLSQGLLGSIVSIIANGAPAYILIFLNQKLYFSPFHATGNLLVSITASLFPCLIFNNIDLILLASQIVPAFIATVFHLFLLVWIVHWIEREKRTWLAMKVVIAVLLIGTLSLTIWGIFFLGTKFGLTEDQLLDIYYQQQG